MPDLCGARQLAPDLVHLGGRDAATRVRDVHHYAPAFLQTAHLQRRPWRGVLHSVAHHVVDGQEHQVTVTAYRRQGTWGPWKGHHYLAVTGHHGLDHLGDHLRHVHRLVGHRIGVDLTDLAKLGNQRGQPIDLHAHRLRKCRIPHLAEPHTQGHQGVLQFVIKASHKGAMGLPRLRSDALHGLLDSSGVPRTVPSQHQHHDQHNRSREQRQCPQFNTHLEHLGRSCDPHPDSQKHPHHGDRPGPHRFSHAARTSGWKRYPTPWTVSMTSSPRAPSTLRSSATR